MTASSTSGRPPPWRHALRSAYTQTWSLRSWSPRAAATMQGHSTSAVTSSYAELFAAAAAAAVDGDGQEVPCHA